MDENLFNSLSKNGQETIGHNVSTYFAGKNHGASFLSADSDINLSSWAFIITHSLQQMEDINLDGLHNNSVSIYNNRSNLVDNLRVQGGENDPIMVTNYILPGPSDGRVTPNVREIVRHRATNHPDDWRL